jgi:hypothetical protein
VNQLVDEANATANEGLMKPVDAPGAASLELFPNPAQGRLNLRFTAMEAGSSAATVSDITGRVLLNTALEIQEGTNTLKLPLQGLAPGIYILKLAGYAAQRFQVIQ